MSLEGEEIFGQVVFLWYKSSSRVSRQFALLGVGIDKVATAGGQVSKEIKSSNSVLLTWLFVISTGVKGKLGQKADQNTGG